MSRWAWIDRVTNVAILTLALLLGVLLWQRYHIGERPNVQVPIGSQVKLQRVDWVGNGTTVILVLSTECRFCSQNAALYADIASYLRATQYGRSIALLPEDISRSGPYLANLKVRPDEIREGPVAAVGAKATPTIVVIGRDGRVIKSWVGRLSASAAAAVLRDISSIASKNRPRECSACAISQ